MSDDLYIPPGASEREIAIRRRVHRIAGFYQHLAVYLAVNLGLWTINAIQVWNLSGNVNRWAYWAIFPTIGWGIGVLVHGLSVLPIFGGVFAPDWEERKVRELMERDRA